MGDSKEIFGRQTVYTPDGIRTRDLHRERVASWTTRRREQKKKNTPSWNRTNNLKLRRLSLYPIELWEHRIIIKYA